MAIISLTISLKYSPHSSPMRTRYGMYFLSFNSLRLSDTIWWHRSWCLMAPSHYLNQCWFVIRSVLWHSPRNKFHKCSMNLIRSIACIHRLYLKICYHISQGPESYSLWPSDIIGRQGSSSTLAQVMACCLMAPSHYLNQCWLIIS